MAVPASHSLPRWTWIAPLVVCIIGAYISNIFQIQLYISTVDWPVALGLVMAVWWGPRVLPGVYLGALISALLWGPYTTQAPLFALPDLLAVAAGWLFFTRLFHARAHLPTFNDLIYLIISGVGPLAVLQGYLTAGLLVGLGHLPGSEWMAWGVIGWLSNSLSLLAVSVPLLVFATPLLEKAGWTLTRGAQLPEGFHFLRRSNAERLEMAFVMIAMVLASLFVPFDRFWVLFSFFGLWAAVRFGFGVAILTNVLLQGLILYLPRFFPTFLTLIVPPNFQGNVEVILNLMVPGYAVIIVGRALSDLRAEIERRQTSERALRQSEERLHAVIDKMPILLDALDEKTEIIAWNQECERVTGYSADFVLHNPAVWDLLYPQGEEKNRIRAAGENLGSYVRDQEYEMVTRGGEKKIISWSNISGQSPIPGWHSWAVGVDVTARRKAEEALQAYADIVQNMQLGIFVYHLEEEQDDRTLRLNMGNPAASNILGIEADALIGLTLDEIFPNLRALGVSEAFARIARGGKPVSIDEYAFPQPGLLPNYYAIKVFPLPERSVAVLFEDITERKFARDQALLQRDLAQQLTTVHSLDAGLCLSLDAALSIPGMDCGGIHLVKAANAMDLVCHRGLSPEYAAAYRILYLDDPALLVLQTRQAIFTSHNGDQASRSPLQIKEGLRSGATLPLVYQGKLLGCLNVASHQQDDFPEYAKLPLESFAAQIANWIVRLQAEESLQRRTDELGLLVNAAHELSKSLDLDEIFKKLHGYIRESMPCDNFLVSSYSPQDRLIRCVAAWDHESRLDISNLPPIPLEPEGKGSQSIVIHSGEPLLLSDLGAHIRTAATKYYVDDENRVTADIPEEELTSHSALLVPLKLEGQTVGVIQIFSDALNSYTPEHLRLLEALALHVSIAMANANLYQQAQNEIQERRRVEEQLRASLQEKTALIREIHHRVKNNMQVMISLISLQAGKISDDKIRAMFLDSENRIRSMAAVHEQLYQSSSLSQIDFGAYLSRLAWDLQSAYNFIPGIRVEIHVEPITLSIETAIPCGLLVNEVVTNAFKHAFPHGRKGSVEVRLSAENGQVLLSIADNGAGIPAEITEANTDTLGIKLIYLLASQVGGTLELDRTAGTCFTLRFRSN